MKQNSLKSKKLPFNDILISPKSYALLILFRFPLILRLFLDTTAMRQLLFSSHNMHKFSEIRAMVPSEIQLLSLSDCGYAEEIPETGQTLRDNAILKAQFAAERMTVASFADDSGLEVTALNGAPGVYSARYAGEPKNDAANNKKLLDELKNAGDRSAQFKTVIALWWDKEMHIFEGMVSGRIAESPRGSNGFGYDPLFIPDGHERTFAEFSIEEKAVLSHRGRALAKLLAFLNQAST